jgi:hypothetical protein
MFMVQTKKLKIKSGEINNMEKVMGEERKIVFCNEVSLPSTRYATFSLYRYPAKFIPHVISYVLEKYGRPNTKVFDPFAGYGTVGVVSKIFGYDYELWDLNPILEVLHSVATLEPEHVDVKELVSQAATFDGKFVPMHAYQRNLLLRGESRKAL